MDPTTPDMKIRQVLDHWRQVGPIDIARHMQYVPPIETDSSVDPKLVRLTSGIDCLAQLLRHLASHANDIHGYIEEVMVAEKSNPVLAYAWQPFERNQPWPDKDEMAAAVAQKMEVIKEMLDDPEPREVAYSFLGLSGSDIMWETYWSRPETSLFAKVIYQESTSGRWRARERTRYDLRCAAIHLDRTLNSSQTLQGAVNSSFGPHTGSDGLPEIRLAAGAEIARVFYRPSSGHSLPFGHLYEFDLPLGVPNLAEAMANATGTVPVRWRVHYRLFAVIRQSPVSLFRPQGPDYIRTYNHSGTKVDMHWKPSSIVNDTWSVEDDVPGVSYTLVYLKRAPLPGLVPSEFGVAAPASRILRTASSSRRPDGTRRTRRGKRAGASKDSSLPGTSPSTDPPASASTSAQTFPPSPTRLPHLCSVLQLAHRPDRRLESDHHCRHQQDPSCPVVNPILATKHSSRRRLGRHQAGFMGKTLPCKAPSTIRSNQLEGGTRSHQPRDVDMGRPGRFHRHRGVDRRMRNLSRLLGDVAEAEASGVGKDMDMDGDREQHTGDTHTLRVLHDDYDRRCGRQGWFRRWTYLSSQSV